MSYYAERVGDPGEPNPEWHGDAVASHREIQALIRENSKLRGDKNELACEVSRLREAGNALAQAAENLEVVVGLGAAPTAIHGPLMAISPALEGWLQAKGTQP